MKKCRWNVRCFWKKNKVIITSFLFAILGKVNAFAQDGVAGINEANQKVRSYFDAGTELMYAVGAILGLIGAVKVYQKWNAGDPDTGKVAAAWFGSCVFLVVVATVIKSFFGV
ncbi:DUF4134 domain-containing protein [Flavobacterium agrisoli]|uniref:DUF4134 domain-containing protein n=1 Tax=Flavobacterium agrisoli TaxID=2793066 RepID=A0A934UI48_9FLAO|nr:DUF4134 domain-containing protein [Flavobacterium agrisoli]MBK0368234.1 DUF4134 domain-containing protein [Flavobacterium agrisoli]